jgi:hypothetical protein
MSAMCEPLPWILAIFTLNFRKAITAAKAPLQNYKNLCGKDSGRISPSGLLMTLIKNVLSG